MKARCAPVVALLSALFLTPAHAVPLARHVIVAQTNEPPACPPPSAGVVGLLAAAAQDTVFYGGTTWAADSMRWEGVRDSVWTFDTGIGSSINAGGNPNKPAGYHQTMEGWFGLDQTLIRQPYFRRSSTCAINGSFSAWAGVTPEEASKLCYVSGQGYGNGWSMYFGKHFVYPGSGSVTFSYTYAVECESSFDYAYVIVDTTGGMNPDAAPDAVTLAVHTGTVSGTGSFILQPGVDLPSSPGTFAIWFNVASDGSYSDEDGLDPSACGHSAFDDITLSGAVTDFTDFEAGSNGWAQYLPATAIGDYSDLASLFDLPPPATFCPCAMQDSVLVFFDETFQHPYAQDNLAVSPWIDLKRGGDTGRPGRVMTYDVYAHLPIQGYAFVQIRARSYPFRCPDGTITTSPFRDQNTVFYYGEAPFCSPQGTPIRRDYSSVIGPEAEQVQVAWGYVHITGIIVFKPRFPAWSSMGNDTPYIDNVRVGVFGAPGAPIVTLTPFDRFQDSFATDGSLDPGSTGRMDPARIKNASGPVAGARMADTLVARGNGGNTEVRLVFQIRPGPFADLASLAARAARWTPEPAIAAHPGALAGTWYSARMDTAEQGGALSAGNWMSTHHEADPGFLGTDRMPDPADPSELENEILPDRLLTPGSRVDYFVQTRYIPPDPRNAGGMTWFLVPDTSGGIFHEAEVLPASVDGDSTWNCTLYVDDHADRNFEEQAIEEAALGAALGSGGAPEGTRYDRYDVMAPTVLSLGRPPMSNVGASMDQVFGYRTIAWHAGTLSSMALVDADAVILGAWLRTPGAVPRHFWGTGDGLAHSMNAAGQPAALDFMQNVLGVTRICNTVRDAGCPSGSALDSTACLPLANVSGSAFATALPVSARGNGCSELRSFDLLGVSASVATARGQLDYTKNGGPRSHASVTNEIAGVGSRTVVDGFALGSLRSQDGTPHNLAACSSPLAAWLRTQDVLSWFDVLLDCSGATSSVTDPAPAPAPPRPRLDAPRPNPARGSTVVTFASPADGLPVRLEIFDVTGRLVTRLIDAPLPSGPHEASWTGVTGAGRSAAAGLYFVRLRIGGWTDTKTVVLTR